MLLQTWSEVLTESFQGLWGQVISFVPSLVVALIIFIVGWVVGAVLGRWVAEVVRAVKIDRALKGLNIDELLERGGFKLDSGLFVGGLVKWFVIVVFLVASVDVLGLEGINFFLRDVVLGYLPNVIGASIILLLAAVIAELVQKVVVGGAKAAKAPAAELYGGVARWAIWIFALLAALDQLGIAEPFVQTLFTGAIAMLALAGGLAFGLGGRDAAARYIEKLRGDIGGR